MKATIKIVHESKFLGKDGQLMIALWCVICIGDKEFARTFYVRSE